MKAKLGIKIDIFYSIFNAYLSNIRFKFILKGLKIYYSDSGTSLKFNHKKNPKTT